MRQISAILISILFIFACSKSKTASPAADKHILPPLLPGSREQPLTIQTGNTNPADLVAFACSLQGAPYEYGATDPEHGFDCSGFVTYVFNHFGIRVPRPSVDFTYANKEIDITRAKPGDLVLFTGTDPTVRIVGHIGIITSNNAGSISFIHSSSGQQCSVVESAFDAYYQRRYVKTIRVFPQNNQP